MLTRYGYSTLGIIAIIVFLFIVASFFLQNNALRAFFIIIPVAFLVFSLNFFRDPERTPPNRDNVVVSPADGRVLFVKEVMEDKFIRGRAKQISVFMSPLNVHVNRIPVDGKVEFLEYHKGKFIKAFEDKASEINERTEIGITGKYGKVFFTQVAGFVARRIVCELNPGENVKMGERFGMIKFGSRVDVIVPYNWIEKVNKDDIVKAGETILFEVAGQ